MKTNHLKQSLYIAIALLFTACSHEQTETALEETSQADQLVTLTD